MRNFLSRSVASSRSDARNLGRKHRARRLRLEMLEDRIVLWNTFMSLGIPDSVWSYKNLSYSYSNLLDGWLTDDGMTTSDAIAAVEEAMGLWTSVTPLTFFQLADSGPAPGDGKYDPIGHPFLRWGHHYIDGNSGQNILAHGTQPGDDGKNGDMHFDDSNTWTFNTFLETAIHEFGHAIGMAHANGDVQPGQPNPAPKPAIMDAVAGSYSFNGRDSAYLFDDDVDGIRSLYGTGLGYVIDSSGTLNIYGTGRSDLIVLNSFYQDGAGWQLTASTNSGSFTRPAAGVSSIRIHGLNGNDITRIEGNAGLPVTVLGGVGDDIVDFSFNSGFLGNITGRTTFVGGDGTDRVYLYDDRNGVDATFNILPFSIGRAGSGVVSLSRDVESQTVTTGHGLDTVNVAGLFQPLFLNSTGGRDIVNVGTSTGSLGLINADIQVQNDPSYTTLNINGGGGTLARNLTIDKNGSFGYVTGMSTGNINWDVSDIDSINITTGSAVDTVNIARNTETLNLNSSGGRDVVNLGRAGNMQEITGAVTIRNSPSYTSINADDSNDNVHRTVTVSTFLGSDGLSYGSITGLAPAPIYYKNADTLDVTLRTGTPGSEVSIIAITKPTSIIGRGLNAVRVGTSDSGMANILSTLTVSNPTGSTVLSLNDLGDTAPNTITMTSSSVTGLGPYPVHFAESDLAGLFINAGSGGNTINVENTPGNSHPFTTYLYSGEASDTLNIKATTGPLKVLGTGGFDLVFIGNVGSLSGIRGAIDVSNFTGRTVLGMNDEADPTARTATLERGRLSWNNYAAPITWKATSNLTGGVTFLGINLGKSADTLIVNDIDPFYSYVYLQTGPGNDLIQVNKTTGSIYAYNQGGTDTHSVGGPGVPASRFAGLVYSYGVAGARNDVILDVSGSTNNMNVSLNNGTVDGLAPTQFYAEPVNTRSLAIKTGSGVDRLTLSSLRSGIAYSFDGGNGSDTLFAENGVNTWNLTVPGAGSLVASFPAASPSYSYTLGFAGIEHLRGGAGDDTFRFAPGGGVAGTIQAGTGFDKLDYAGRGSAVTVNLQTSAAPGVAAGFVGIESVTGSSQAGDTLIGPNTGNTWTITATNGGKVNAITYAGFENLTGGTARDVFKPSAGKGVTGTINGGLGVDWLDYTAYTTAMAVNLAAGTATNMGAILNIENVRAGRGGSTLTGNAVGNILVGNTGADTIRGGSGRSLLIGGRGLDSILAGSNQDIVTGDYTTLDANNAALEAILLEWKSGTSYEVRVGHLRSGGGLNGSFKLLYGSTVKDDGSTESLRGGTGREWFLKSVADTITDKAIDEWIN